MFNKSFNACHGAFTLPFIKLLSIVFPKAPYAHAAWAHTLAHSSAKVCKAPFLASEVNSAAFWQIKLNCSTFVIYSYLT